MFRTRSLYILVLTLLLEVYCNDSPSVVIVGAGAAGIAAATRLLENNITNITVLEAEGRIGGRIHSVKFGDSIVDLGAQFCYGQKGNVIYDLVEKFNLLAAEELKLTLYHSSAEYGDDVLQDEEFYNMFHSIYSEERKGNEVSLGDYMIKRYNESIIPYYKFDREKLKYAGEFFHFYMKHILSMEGAFSWFDISAKSDFKECEGDHLLNWKGRGYKTILDVLTKKYPNPQNQLPIDNKILLNKEVSKITWDGNDPKLQCADGTIYITDHVIFTPSLGVLKHAYKSLFEPTLPQEKISAIRELGIAAVVNVFLHFPTRWWPSHNFTDFTFIWTDEDMQLLLQEFLDGPSENGKSWLLDLLAVYPVEENPNVLLASFTGEFVKKIELCDDNTLADGIMFVLNKFVGSHFDNMTKPDAVVRYNWHSNPHFRGAYSFQTVASRKTGMSAELILSEPLTSSNGKQTLLFAGEATHPTFYSTVHGAIETGHREAQRIIDFYK